MVQLIDTLNKKRQGWKEGAPERARLREQNRIEAERNRAIAEELRIESLSKMPRFVVKETREVTVAAESMNDAIRIASIAFKKGQEDDGSLEWFDRPSSVEGDTLDKIRTTNIKATEEDD